MTVVLLN
jgi:hypothetical protein